MKFQSKISKKKSLAGLFTGKKNQEIKIISHEAPFIIGRLN